MFLKADQAKAIAKKFGTPVFVYSQQQLRQQVQQMLDLPAPYGLTVRYAMKANPNKAILKFFDSLGIAIDASSEYEAERAILAGIKPQRILLTAQELPVNLKELVVQGVLFNACSLHQLEAYGQVAPDTAVSLRINPGLGSGHDQRVNVGGPTSSFGIWHEQLDEAKALLKKYRLKVKRLHTHIGSGTDPKVWQKVAQTSLDLVKEFKETSIINLGGGFKAARMPDEPATDVQSIGLAIADSLNDFYQETGRQLHLEVEPGTFLVANAGLLLTIIKDIVSTGQAGYTFLKIDSGMTEIIRPTLYGSQHPITIINGSSATKPYVVVGHCCESGDLLTPQPGQPEMLATRELNQAAINDLAIIGGVGAYCSAMSAVNYNSFPQSPEVMLKENGDLQLIRRRQQLSDILKLEV